MTNSLLKIQYILDSTPLTVAQRSEANAHLAKIQQSNQELSSKLEALRTEIEQLKQN